MNALNTVLANPTFKLSKLTFGGITLEGENLQLLLNSRPDAENSDCFYKMEALTELNEALAELLPPPPAPSTRSYTPRATSSDTPETSAEEEEEEKLAGYYFSVFRDKKRVRIDEIAGSRLEKLRGWYDSLPDAAKEKLVNGAQNDDSAPLAETVEAVAVADGGNERLTEDAAF